MLVVYWPNAVSMLDRAIDGAAEDIGPSLGCQARKFKHKLHLNRRFIVENEGKFGVVLEFIKAVDEGSKEGDGVALAVQGPPERGFSIPGASEDLPKSIMEGKSVVLSVGATLEVGFKANVEEAPKGEGGTFTGRAQAQPYGQVVLVPALPHHLVGGGVNGPLKAILGEAALSFVCWDKVGEHLTSPHSLGDLEDHLQSQGFGGPRRARFGPRAFPQPQVEKI